MPGPELTMESKQFSLDKVRGTRRDGFSLFVKCDSAKLTGGAQREVSEDTTSTPSTQSPDMQSTETSAEGRELHPCFRKKLVDFDDGSNWTFVPTRGTKPAQRYNHGAAVVGRKLLVIGGENGTETGNDVQMLHLGKLSWSKIGVGNSAPSKGLKTGPPQQLPYCKGHSLISWGKTVILIGGEMDPASENITVWSFDLEMDCWTSVVTKGEIPTARRGQTVSRAGSILIMFGGEDAKGRKLNDLHILDLKSLLWLPLYPSGKWPSPRARHVADMYNDRFLFIFGGETRSKIANDIYGLDFDNMEWSKLKSKGSPPTARAGHAGALVGDKWYIAGGKSNVPGTLDTTALDISRMEWSVVAPASVDSVASVQGLSVVYVQRKEKKFLVAFGGCGTDMATNAVHVLHIDPEGEPPRNTLGGLLKLPTSPEPIIPAQTGSRLFRSQQGAHSALLGSSIPCACVNVAKANLLPVNEHRSSISRSLSEFSSELDRDSGLIPLRKRYAMTQSSKMDVLSRRSTSLASSTDEMVPRPGSQASSWDSNSSLRRRDRKLPRLKDLSSAVAGPEGSERQRPGAQRIRGDLQITESTAQSVDSGFLRAEELQITPPSVRPGLLSSVGDAGTLFLQVHASVSGRTRSCEGSPESSEFSGYAETFVSGTGEERISDQSLINSGESNSNMSCASSESLSSCCASNTVAICEEDELTMLSKRTNTNPVYEDEVPLFCTGTRTRYEGDLAIVSNITFVNDEDDERALQTAIQSRQHSEGRLGNALKRIKDLQDRVQAMECCQEEFNNLVQNARVVNLKLEQDLALKSAVLEETQLELQAAREVLLGEGTRAFQLQMELFEVKQKLQSLHVPGILQPCARQPILA